MREDSFDVRVEDLLQSWAPAIGRPSCAPGCSACCERMTVTVTSVEALRLLQYFDEQGLAASFRSEAESRLSTLSERIRQADDPDSALDAILDLGECMLLDGRTCSAYPARPDACRVCYVWHDAAYCGRSDYDMCTPAELNQIRVAQVYESMLAERAAGRIPFWGNLLPALWLMDRFREEYSAGEDLSSRAEAGWLRTELLEFPSETRLLAEKAEHERLFAEEANPFGYPRANGLTDRELLEPFPLD